MKSTIRFIFKFSSLIVLSVIVSMINIFSRGVHKGGTTQDGADLSMLNINTAYADVVGGPGPGGDGDGDCDGPGPDGPDGPGGC